MLSSTPTTPASPPAPRPAGRGTARARRSAALVLAVAACAWQWPSAGAAATLPPAAELAAARFLRIDRVGADIVGVQALADWPAPEQPAPQLQCRQPALHQPAATRGAWIWDSRELLRDPARARRLLQRLADAGLRRLALQVDPRRADDDYVAVLALAARLGLQVHALSGEPDDVLHPEHALAVVAWVARFNQRHPELRLQGVEFDIEPYLLPDFAQRRDAVYADYLGLLGRLRHDSAEAGLRLAVVVPFWFADTPWRDGSLLEPVAREVDSLSVMSYRTDAAQREAIANNALCIGELYARPVRLGLETVRLPLEQHAIVAADQAARVLRAGRGGAQLAVTPSELDALAARHWSDRPGRVSFYPETDAALAAARTPMPYASFSGWMINGLDSAWGHDAQRP